LYHLTAGTMIVLMVEAAEKQQLPEAPISITVMAYYAGFADLVSQARLDDLFGQR